MKDRIFNLIQLYLIGLSLANIQNIVVTLCSIATFTVYFIISFDKVLLNGQRIIEIIKSFRKNNGKS